MAQALVCSSKVKAGIARRVKAAQHSADDARYVVYAILDPTQRDPSRSYRGLPIYVGETGDFGSRVMGHFEAACGETARETGRIPYIRRLLREGVVPRFAVLQRFNSRIDAIEAEIRWSQTLLSKGYPLTNLRPWQCEVLPADKIEERVRTQQWATSIECGIEAGVRISASCDWCGRVSIFQPSEFLAYFSPWEALRNIRAMAANCHSCGSGYDHAIVRRHEAVVAVAPPSALDWEL